MPVFAATIFLSAFLLFLVQPIIAKQILAWFGGAPAVWNTCMVFFQALLLLGYAYSDWSTRKLSPRAQALLHTALLAASVLLLPIAADASWKPGGEEDPVGRILVLLTATIGLQYFLLSSTGPLVQACFVRRFGGERVYRLFALSNLGSLLALLAYPLVIETVISTRAQAIGWSAAYVGYAVLCAACLLLSVRNLPAAAQASAEPYEAPPTLALQLLWLALAGMGTVMLLSITNHITQNISSIPLLWLAPLTLYLLSFILCFEGRGWYRRRVFLPLFVAAVVGMAWALQTESGLLELRKAIPLYLAGLFIACMLFHGELALSRPAPRYLTRFYLMLSLGGALGGVAVGLLAPRVFTGYYELPLGLLAGGVLAALALWRPMRWGAVAAVLATAWAGVYVFSYTKDVREEAVLVTRNFFGVLRVQDSGEGLDKVRRLVHGTIMHGKQSFNPDNRGKPLTYYGETSGIGRLFAAFKDRSLKTGVVGLGTGTIAAYGRAGDVLRFYDINPQVMEIAQKYFTYLSDSRGRVETVLGDARLSMEREAPQGYDILAIDAFSSDSIPVHLITVEAMDVYLRHMKPDGVIAFHVTNRYLDLQPVVKLIAEARGLQARVVSDDGDPVLGASTDWILVSRGAGVFDHREFEGVAEQIETPAGRTAWSDDFNNLFQALK
jgi:SAM-dependent methyltransferase